jgi:hypothetical protein
MSIKAILTRTGMIRRLWMALGPLAILVSACNLASPPASLYSSTISLDPKKGNHFSAQLPANTNSGSVRLVIKDKDGKELFAGSVDLTAK